MLQRLAFLPSLVYNIVLEKIRYRRWFDRIDETVILGALPWRSIAPQLIEKHGVRGVISMNENFELNFTGVMNGNDWRQMNVKFLQLETGDFFHAPSQDKIELGVNFLKDFESKGQSVYVHCKAGRTRSSCLVACYFVQKYDMSPEQAVSFIKKKRHQTLIHSKQWQAIRTYAQNHKSH